MYRTNIKTIHAFLLFGILTRTVSSQCSETNKQATEYLIVNETLSTFNTPGYRIAYYSNMDCKWVFDAGTPTATIVFDINEVMIESSRNCRYDHLKVYQGSDTSGTLVDTLCGRYYSGKFIAVSGQHATLQLKADRSRQYAGASMNVFFATDQSGSACSGTPASLTATTSMAFLTSPGYPVSLATGLSCGWSITESAGTVLYLAMQYSDTKYDKEKGELCGLSCSWSITGSAGTVLYLAIQYSDMEYDIEGGGCSDQVLTLYDGTSTSSPALVEAWCDSREAFPSRQTVYYTTGNNAYITLTTGATTGRHGFRLNYKQNSTAITTTTTIATTTTVFVELCSSTPTRLTATSTWQYFRSINYPDDYANNLNCYWLIEAPVGFTINLTITDSNIQYSDGCINDAVTVYDGSTTLHPLMSKFCGEVMQVFASTSRYMYIYFKTDPTIGYRGFSAQYQTVTAEVPSCAVSGITANLTATEAVQTISSPGYPNGYNNSEVTYWMISNINETQVLTIEIEDSRIEGSVGCKYDRVQIYQGPCSSYPLLGQFCGSDRPTYNYDTGSYALVVMTTDDTVAFKGFQMKFYLTDAVDDSYSKYIIGGIIAGSVIGGLALVGGIAFGITKYMKHSKGRAAGSAATSRSSSRSSINSSDVNSGNQQSTTSYEGSTQRRPNRLPPIKEYVPANIYK